MRAHHLLVIGLLAIGACRDDLARKTERAAERVERATYPENAGSKAATDDVDALVEDFRHLRSLRVQSLRAEHAVAASQPLVIYAIASMKPLLPTARHRLEQNLMIFRERLAETRQLIEQLQYVDAASWEHRDDEVARAMAGMFLARDASWQALEDKPDEPFPQT